MVVTREPNPMRPERRAKRMRWAGILLVLLTGCGGAARPGRPGARHVGLIVVLPRHRAAVRCGGRGPPHPPTPHDAGPRLARDARGCSGGSTLASEGKIHRTTGGPRPW